MAAYHRSSTSGRFANSHSSASVSVAAALITVFTACSSAVSQDRPGDHDDGLLPPGALGELIRSKDLPFLCIELVLLPLSLFAFFASKGAKSKAA